MKEPTWWKKLSSEYQAAYLARHPNSKFHVTKRTKKDSSLRPKRIKSSEQEDLDMKKDAVEALKSHPAHREELRTKLSAVKENPDSALPDDFDDKFNADNLSEDDAEEIKTEASKVTNKSDFKRLAKKIAIIAGVGVIGSALLVTGGLPYAILAGHLLRDATDSFKDFNDRIESGENSVKAAMGATKTWITSAMSNGTLLASSLIMNTKTPEDKRTKVVKPNSDKSKTSDDDNSKSFEAHKEKTKQIQDTMRQRAEDLKKKRIATKK